MTSNWDRTVKREQLRFRLADIFSNGRPETILSHPYNKRRLADPVDEEEDEDEPVSENSKTETDEKVDETELPEALRRAFAAMLAACNKQETQETPMPTSTPDSYEKILKDHGGSIQEIAKNIVAASDASGISEYSLFKLAEIEALKTRKSFETPAQAFSRYYQSEEATPLRKAMQIAKRMNYGIDNPRGHGF
jgi:hypothetical protein